MSLWAIQLLGGLAARRSGQEVTRFRTQKAASLLATLAFHAAPQPRETLIELLWPETEPEAGRHNLSNALSFLRRALEPPGVPPGSVLLADRPSVRLNPAAFTTDVFAFERALRQAAAPGLSEAERLALRLEAGVLFRGPLLPGFYDDWIAPQATRLSSLFVDLVGQVVPPLLAAGRREEALSLAERAVTTDPFSEPATRRLMEVLAAMEQPSPALRAYRQLEARLRDELDSALSADLQAYARELRAGAGSPGSMGSVGSVGSMGSPDEFVPTAHPPHTAHPPPPTRDPSERLRGGEFLLRTITRFFDRQAEAQRLGELLSAPRTRLVTLTGPGGTGKTRLAVEAGAQLVETAPAGAPRAATFVPLAEVAEAERLYDVILRALGGLPLPGQAPLDQLAAVLGAHPGMLLILDNFEQLVEEGALLLRNLLARADVKLLVTSRQRLGIEGERELRVAPLPVPRGGSGESGPEPPPAARAPALNPEPSPEPLLASPSVQLFADRAQAARPDFRLTERNAAAVGQLCDRLDGLPLAIELAAARVSVLSPARILEQVSANRLDFLATRRRDSSARQRTLRSTLDWSYQLLPPEGRRLLAELSVFRGGWMLEAAQAVGRLSEAEALDLLMLLRDSSLISVVDTEEGLRFTMLDTLREYCRDQLVETGQEVGVRRRHCDFFLALAEEAEPHFEGPEEGAWLDRLEVEHENLRAALEHCQQADARLRLVGALWRFWRVRGHWRAARAYLSEALAREAGPGDSVEQRASRARALNGAGVLAHHQGDYRLAASQFEEALAIYRQLGDRWGIASVLDGLGTVAQELGDYAAAHAYHAESMAIQRELQDRRAIAVSSSHLGNLALKLGDHAAARARFEESLAIRQELGDRRGIALSLSDLAFVAKEQGRYPEARAWYEQSLALYHGLGDKSYAALARHFLGVVAEHEGDLGLARSIYEECAATFRELGDQSQVAWTLHGLGFLTCRQGDFAAARSLLSEGLAAFRAMEHTIGVIRTLERFGGLAVAQGEMERAARLLGSAAQLRAATGARAGLAEEQELERDAAAARESLGAEAFASAWAEGQAMTEPQASAYALGER
jgi:predicted ATPase/DNA-binding SARP family transcriptional activator